MCAYIKQFVRVLDKTGECFPFFHKFPQLSNEKLKLSYFSKANKLDNL